MEVQERTKKHGATQERPWSTESTATGGEGREYRKPARERRLRRVETRRSATHETMPGNLREDEMGKFTPVESDDKKTVTRFNTWRNRLRKDSPSRSKRSWDKPSEKSGLFTIPQKERKTRAKPKGKLWMPSSSNYREKRPAPDKKPTPRCKIQNTRDLKSQHCSNGTSSGASEPSHVTTEPSSSRQQNKKSSGTSEPFHVTTEPFPSLQQSKNSSGGTAERSHVTTEPSSSLPQSRERKKGGDGSAGGSSSLWGVPPQYAPTHEQNKTDMPRKETDARTTDARQD